ncbi:dephospho-CoA kinase [Pseudomarimonas arenosa]|uniref:Dephospho-CoA kinase n=1 Tax=Pseudomarimonas arenosa TaxID=2774145 RepID=A0AAW3ZFS7_9GAMM|nr:dephospho-CoA kinase [Pseudomarimonas arenosa]MBD8524199.1 dephospho-CoA kinase [Pseudomarimonas arenosa]
MNSQVPSLTVAVTGGIASGKTAVTDRFAEHAVPVIDADLISRELVEPEQPALKEIAAHFGNPALDAEGRLDRGWMRQRVFANPADRKVLESILHPRVRATMRERARHAGTPYVVLAIPLLSETGAYAWVDRVLVVDAPTELQVQRLMRRDRTDREQAERMLQSQSSRPTRLALANDVLINDGSLALLQSRVDRLHRRLQGIARTRDR